MTTTLPCHGAEDFAVSFIEPRLVAVGSSSLVHGAIDQKNGPNVTSNDEMMKLVRTLDGGNAWALGRFDAIQQQAHLPAGVASQIPPITWFSISSHINGGIRGTVRAETRDAESANNLRDVVGGFLALAKMQAGSNERLQAMRGRSMSARPATPSSCRLPFRHGGVQRARRGQADDSNGLLTTARAVGSLKIAAPAAT